MANNTKYNDTDLHQVYCSIAKLMSLFYINYDEFYKTLRAYYVQEVYKQDNTIIRTALTCGVDRRIVSNIIKHEKLFLKPPFLLLIKERIEKIANNNQVVLKTGKHSVTSIINEVMPGATTVATVVDELCELGYVEDRGDHIIFINKPFEPILYQEKVNISAHFVRYLHTFIHNMACQNQRMKRFERNILTTRVPSDSAQALATECQAVIDDFSVKITKIFKSYELDIANNSHMEIGISMFQFNLNDE